jgi:hypothetical protein
MPSLLHHYRRVEVRASLVERGIGGGSHSLPTGPPPLPSSPTLSLTFGKQRGKVGVLATGGVCLAGMVSLRSRSAPYLVRPQ